MDIRGLTRLALGEAIGFLEEAVRHGFSNRDWLKHDVDLDPVRDSPRFRALSEGLQ